MKEEIEARLEVVIDVDLSGVAIDFPHADIIDSRDIESRIQELAGEFEDVLYNYKNADGKEEIEEYTENLENWLDEYEDEYVSLLAFKGEVDSYTSEWYDGAQIIEDRYFEDYARELAEDIGAIDKNAAWPLSFIDWEAASDALKIDYSEINFDGRSYWIRS
jgi:hypothetical protein